MHNDIKKDLYEILGVSRSASKEDIKGAYRKKARECHPDVAHNDPEGERKFKELTFAYEVLSDPQKRRDYDTWGLDGLRRGAGSDFNGFGNISDLFDAFFGGGFTDPFGGFTSNRSYASKKVRTDGRDLETIVSIDLEDVMAGIEKEVEIERQATCSECAGKGMKPDTKAVRCEVCNGSGHVRQAQRSLLGAILRTQTCTNCQGKGEVFTDPCEGCGGEGLSWVKEKVKVTVPAGVERGDRLRMLEKGEGGRYGGKTGDLYIAININPHEQFKRDGRNLYTTLVVDMEDAALGDEIVMNSLDGEFKLKIPAGTQHGDVIRVKGEGLPPRHGGRKGEILVSVQVSIPRKLSTSEKRLLQEFKDKRNRKK
ncbi:MAG: molecular chaperone DnaJ [Actinobacteria bacterium]|nr:molecular chaperone DnaJ [Actinomycetota bacterium]